MVKSSEAMIGHSARCRVLLLGASALFLLAWLLPNHYRPWLAAYQDFASFLAGLLVLSALPWQSFVLRRDVALFFLLPLLPPLQWAAGLIHFSGDALLAFLYLAGFAWMLLAGCNLARDVSGRRYLASLLAGLLVIGAVLSCWIAWRQWLLLSGSIWVADLALGARPYANLGQPNNLATLLCMGVCGVLYFYERQLLGRLSSGMIVAFLISGIALTQSRTPWVGAVLLLLFWAWKSSGYSMRLRLHAMSLWVGAYAACVLALPYLAELLLLSSSDPLERVRSMERLGLWAQFWQAVWQGPLWGYGWGQVGSAQVSVAVSHPFPIMTEHSHNILLDLLLWNGPVVGGAIVVGLIFWLGRLSWGGRTAEGLFALMASGALLLHGMLEYPLEYAFFLLPLGLLLGLVAAESETAEFRLPRWLPGAMLLPCLGLFAWLWHDYRIIEEDYRLMRFESRNIGTLKAEQAAPNVLLLNQLRELVRLERTEPRAGVGAEELQWMQEVAHRYPFRENLLRYVLALALNGQVDAACRQMLVLSALHGEAWYAAAVTVLQEMQSDHPQLKLLVLRLPCLVGK